ncbi:hypothetical protein JXA56_01945 [Candidatus Micrarchaeota archaeon]|nr:hypothetical protein [Candidatus Micrarchaeota archaeon]
MYLTGKDTPVEIQPKKSSVLLEKTMKHREKPVDPFQADLSLKSLFLKLALVSMFILIVSFGLDDLNSLTIASFAGVVMFSLFYGFLRIRK